jgi:hypothetical protein
MTVTPVAKPVIAFDLASLGNGEAETLAAKAARTPFEMHVCTNSFLTCAAPGSPTSVNIDPPSSPSPALLAWWCEDQGTYGLCQGWKEVEEDWEYLLNLWLADPCSDEGLDELTAWGDYGISIHVFRCCTVVIDGSVTAEEEWNNTAWETGWVPFGEWNYCEAQ